MVMVHFFEPCEVLPGAVASSGSRILPDAAHEASANRTMRRLGGAWCAAGTMNLPGGPALALHKADL
jgi:hypothetical protein